MDMSDGKEEQDFWAGEFGNDYVDRCNTLEFTNKTYKSQTGFSYLEIYNSFFSNFNKDLKILELACNVGNKLSILKYFGFKNLYGVEINKKAVEIAKKENPDITFFNSSIEDFDPKDEKFDIVCTSGILIHIHPEHLNLILQKIESLSQKYIFGFENFSEIPVEVPYRGHKNKLWKKNFPNAFRKLYPNLKTLKEQKIAYKSQSLTDIFYLFEKEIL
jgi:pseudaminic acid biosynthesis-associated methylase